jgi:hypothetical protein
LLDPHIFPVHIQFIRQDHGQMRLHALAHLRIFGKDGYDAVGRHANKRHRIKCRCRRGSRRRLRQGGRRRGWSQITGNQNSSARDGRNLQK